MWNKARNKDWLHLLMNNLSKNFCSFKKFSHVCINKISPAICMLPKTQGPYTDECGCAICDATDQSAVPHTMHVGIPCTATLQHRRFSWPQEIQGSKKPTRKNQGGTCGSSVRCPKTESSWLEPHSSFWPGSQMQKHTTAVPWGPQDKLLGPVTVLPCSSWGNLLCAKACMT